MRKVAKMSGDELSISDVMSILNLSRTTVLGLNRSHLHPAKIGGRWIYRLADVEAERERREGSNKILRRTSPDGQMGPGSAALGGSLRRDRPPVYDGAIASEAVRLIKDGKDRRQLVEDLKITFEVADHLWKVSPRRMTRYRLPAEPR